MVRSCVAFGCHERYLKGNGIQFHRFPLSRPKLLKSWENAVRRKDWKPTIHSYLCSKHFTKDSYENSLGIVRNRLKEDAVPSIFSYKCEKPQRPNHKRLSFLTPEMTEVSQDNTCINIITNLEGETLTTKSDGETLTNKSDGEIALTTDGSEEEIPIINLEEPTLPTNSDESVETRRIDQSMQTDARMGSPQKQQLRKEIKRLKRSVRRKKCKIENFTQLVTELKEKIRIDEDLENILKSNFGGFPLEFIMNMKSNNKSRTSSRYSDLMKQFSVTLHFYSPKAYKFLRKNFPLPHPNRIKAWISRVQCQPGYLDEVFDFLKNNIEKPSFEDLKECSLIFDCMSLRKQLIWDSSKQALTGYVDLGGIAFSTSILPEQKLANEALVFQIVSYKKKFRCPIAYFLVNGVSTLLLTEAIRNCLVKLYEVGVTIRSVTCDGAAANIHALNSLGCHISPIDLKSFFRHPSVDLNVYAILDPCHMLKLARNSLAEKRVLIGPDGDIKWDFVVKLQQLQNEEQLNFANKLSNEHVHYHNKKMKVSLAAQTLSSSVADAIEFLDNSNHPEFNGSTATALYLRKIDRMFDILNSRNVFGKGYKQPLNLYNISSIKTFFEEMEKYLMNLKADGIPLLDHPRRTFALGFMTSMKSVIQLATEFLIREENPLKYFLTYKLSQDHLELFFSCIRARGGWNNNPNCQQFKSAMRALLLKNSISPGTTGNVIDIGFTSYLPVSEFRSEKRALTPLNVVDSFDNESDQYFEALESVSLTDYQNNILFYIAGFVCRKVRKSLNCSECIALLMDKPLENQSHDHTYAKFNVTDCSSFTKTVTNGGLLFASNSVVKIIIFCEKSFRRVVEETNVLLNKLFINSIVSHIVLNFDIFQEHSTTSSIDLEDLHSSKLIRSVVSTYISLRARSYAKRKTMNEQKTLGMRQKLTKLITFYNV